MHATSNFIATIISYEFLYMQKTNEYEIARDKKMREYYIVRGVFTSSFSIKRVKDDMRQ